MTDSLVYGADVRTAMITGSTSGIGEAAAFALADDGFRVFAVARNEEKGNSLVRRIRRQGGSADLVLLDLADLSSVTGAARSFESRGIPLDVLVNNAAAGPRRGLTVDGFELQFGVNHLGHFALTHHLRRTFRPGTRIVNVTSSMYERAAGITWDSLRKPTRSFHGLKEYAVSKLANVLFTREFAAQQPDWRTYAVHPGFTDTAIIPGYARPFLKRRLHSAEKGAETVVMCASSGEVADQSGGYYSRLQRREVSPVASDDLLATELRRRSEAWCGVAPLH